MIGTISTAEDLLVLYATDSKELDGEVPPVIHLENAFKKIRRNVIVLGRGSPANPVDIRIVARKNGKEIISRKHAEIEKSVDKANQTVRYVIKDIGALNGVYVNNCRIKDHVLFHGDIIQFGGLFNMPMGEMLTISDISVRYQYFSSGNSSSSRSETISTAKVVPKKRSTSSSNEDASHLIDTDEESKKVIPVRKKLKLSSQEVSTQGSTPSNGIHKKTIGGSNSVINRIPNNSNKNDKSHSSDSGRRSATPTLDAMEGPTPNPMEKNHFEELIRDLKVMVSQLEKENSEHKKSAQESASSAREDALAKSKLSREILALKQSLSERERSIVDLKEHLRQSQEKCSSLLEQIASIEKKAQVDLTPSLPVATIRADLTCVLCNKMLLETVVLHCSHGFCRVCLEFRLQGKSGGRKEGNLTCPTCNVTCQPRSRPPPATSRPVKAQGNSHFYFRSDHIDRVIERILEKSSVTLQNEYRDRDAAARFALQNLGIDPDLTLVDEDDGVTLEMEVLSPATGGRVVRGQAGVAAAVAVNGGFLASANNNSNADYNNSSRISTMKVKEIFCDYCGGCGHLEVDCPHDNRHSEDEEDDDDSD